MSKFAMSIRLNDLTRKQLDELTTRFDATQASIVSTAIDRMHREEIKTMTTEIIRRVSIYEHTADFMKASTPPEEQHISLVVSEESGSWYTADVGDINDRARLEAKGAQLLGKRIDPNTMFYNGEATYALGTNPYASNVLFPKQ